MIKEAAFLCIGSSPAGQRAAVQVGNMGLRAGVIENHRVVGGSCINSGTFSSKTFQEAVLALKPPYPGSV